MELKKTTYDYNSEPVRYCSKCYSLQIGYIPESPNTEYCMKCGCSDTEETSIEEWEKLWEERYGEKFIHKNYDIRNHRVFKMTVQELQQFLYDYPQYKNIIKSLYPDFGFQRRKVDDIFSFFNRLVKDGKIEGLRYELIDIYNELNN